MVHRNDRATGQTHENRRSPFATAWSACPSLFSACLVGLFLLLGTVNGQQRQTSTVQTPATFRGADPNAVPDQNSIGDLKWFEVFKDPALQDLVKSAMVQNYDLRTAGARINAARANLGLAAA